MRALYEPDGGIVSVTIVENPDPVHGERLGERAVVHVDDGGRLAWVEVLEPEIGLGDLPRVAARYDLDLEALEASARAALAAPGREVTVSVKAAA